MTKYESLASGKYRWPICWWLYFRSTCVCVCMFFFWFFVDATEKVKQCKSSPVELDDENFRRTKKNCTRKKCKSLENQIHEHTHTHRRARASNIRDTFHGASDRISTETTLLYLHFWQSLTFRVSFAAFALAEERVDDRQSLLQWPSRL